MESAHGYSELRRGLGHKGSRGVQRNPLLRQRSGLVAALLLGSLWQAASAGYPSPDVVMNVLWNALSHEAGGSPDTATLERLFSDQAVVFGSRANQEGPVLVRQAKGEFIDRLRAPRSYRFIECEVDRSVTAEGPFAAVESRVVSARESARESTRFVGINSVQLYRDESGWVIISLYYHVLPDTPETIPFADPPCRPYAAAGRSR